MHTEPYVTLYTVYYWLNLIMMYIATRVRFGQSRFTVSENRGPALATLVSDEPFANEVVLRIIGSRYTATFGECEMSKITSFY